MNRKHLGTIVEVTIHIFLVVGIPLIYLQIKTGFNEYRLPEQMPYVYVYWLVYLAVTGTIYGRRQKRKKYTSPYNRK